MSAVVMLAFAGTALWLGGTVWTVFVAAVALGVLWEWWGLVRAIALSPMARIVWLLSGIFYCGLAAIMLAELRSAYSLLPLLLLLCAVIAVDIGAYFAGRAIGGPKIAPSISPSKTWAGLGGGAIAAALTIMMVAWSWHSGLCELLFPPNQNFIANHVQFDGPCSLGLPPTNYLLTSSVLAGALVAIIAQTGDFFESWMKRRAGVKDSGNLIPGHGGLFDRLDGLLAVLFVIGLISAIQL